MTYKYPLSKYSGKFNQIVNLFEMIESKQKNKEITIDLKKML